MPEETSSLIIRVQSEQVAVANKRLGQLPVAGGKAERATDRLAMAVKRLVVAYVGLRAIEQSVRLLGDFEESMSGVRAVTQATDDQMVQLTATARRLGAETRFSAAQAAEGMRFLGMAGFNTSQILASMEGMLDLATAGQLDLGLAADITSNILSGFNLNASEAIRVADTLAAAASASNTNVAQLGDAMKFVAPIAAGMGLQVEEAAAAVGVLSSAGLQGSMAGTGLRQVLASLATPTREAADILDAYGLSLQDVNPEVNSLTDILTRLNHAGLTASDALLIAGDRGGNALQALVSNLPNMERMNIVMEESEGRAKNMAKVMNDNLKGDALQAKSAIQELILKLGDAGLKRELRGATQATTEFVREINEFISSGEFEAWFDLIVSKLELLSDGFFNAATNIEFVWGETMHFFETDGAGAVDSFKDAMFNLPENVKAVAGGIGAGFGGIVEFASIAGRGVLEQFDIAFNALAKNADNIGEQIKDGLNPFKDEFDFTAESAKVFKEFASQTSANFDNVTTSIELATDAYGEVITDILNERDVEISAADERISAIGKLREEYEKLKIQQKEAREEEQRAAGKPISLGGVEETPRFNVQEFENLRKQLQIQEKSIQESYERRFELIRANTQAGSDLRFELESTLQARLNEEIFNAATDRFNYMLDLQHRMNEAVILGRTSEFESLKLQLEFEEIALAESYERRRDQILEDTSLTERERLDLLTRTEAEFSERLRQLELERTNIVLGNSQVLFAELANVAKDSVGEQNALYKAAFAASKAFAIAESIVKIQQGIASAAATPFPANIAAMAAVAAATASIIGNIRETSLAFEHGGMIPAGKIGMVGETGIEFVRGPAVVSSTRSTADMMGGRQGNSQGNVFVNIQNFTDADVQVKERQTSDGKVLDLIVRRVQSEVANGITRGTSPIGKALENTFALRRGTA